MLHTIGRAGRQIARTAAVTTITSGLLVLGSTSAPAASGTRIGVTVTATAADRPGDHGNPGDRGPQGGNGLAEAFEAHRGYTCSTYGSACGWHPGIGFSCSALDC